MSEALRSITAAPRSIGLSGSALMVTPVAWALVARGIDPTPLLVAAGIDPAELSDPAARFADESVQALWLLAPDHAQCPDFGLYAAHLYREGWFWLLDDLVASAPTLGEAFEQARRHQRLLHDAADARMVNLGPLTRLELLPSLGAPLARALVEFFLGCVVLGCRRLTGRFEHPREVWFRHERPRSTAELERFFECPMQFGAEATALVFPTEWLKVPIVTDRCDAREEAEQRARERMTSLRDGFDLTTRVRVLIGANLEKTEPAFDKVARGLGMSTRTLRRRLRQAGTSYSELVDLVRQRYAARLLLDSPGSIDDVARRLGFANPPAFFKAHKRWTGRTPSEVRESRDVRFVGVSPKGEEQS